MHLAYELGKARAFQFAERLSVMRSAIYAQDSLNWACDRVTAFVPPDDERAIASAYRRRLASYRPHRER